jgi:hypothetical protein
MNIPFSTLTILLPAAVMLHVTEEFLFPGGFVEWYNKLVPPKTVKTVRYGFLVWINTFLIGVCVLPVYYGESFHGISTWYLITSMAGMNACFHIWGVFKMKAYSPGVITGTLLYLPLFILGTVRFISSGTLSPGRAILYVALGIGYHIFSVIRQGK